MQCKLSLCYQYTLDTNWTLTKLNDVYLRTSVVNCVWEPVSSLLVLFPSVTQLNAVTCEKGRLVLLLNVFQRLVTRHEISIALNKHGFRVWLSKCTACSEEMTLTFHSILHIWISAMLWLEHNVMIEIHSHIKLSKYQLNNSYFLLIQFASLLFFVI